MHKVEPVSLIAVLEFAKVFPVRSHNLLVVVLDKCLEDFGVLWIAGIDLGKEGVDQQPFHYDSWLLLPNALA